MQAASKYPRLVEGRGERGGERGEGRGSINKILLKLKDLFQDNTCHAL